MPIELLYMTESIEHWIEQQALIENEQAQHDIINLKVELYKLLRANNQTSTTPQRQPRGVTAAAAAATVLGIGI